MNARRERLVGVRRERVAHAGSVLAHLLVEHDRKGDGKRDLIRQACTAARRAKDIYTAAFKRREALWNSRHDVALESFSASTPDWQRLIVGLGNTAPLETGITLHALYGVPVLRGSALKGLTAHYCDAEIGAGTNCDEWRQGGAKYTVLFGDTEEAGFVGFHDAWLEPESLTRQREGLLADVMTPHHSDYYSGTTYDDVEQTRQCVVANTRIPPTDFDSPIPVPFVSVRGTFHFRLTCQDSSEIGRDYLKFARDLLVAALAEWGIGGKTSSGYGRLQKPAV